MDLDFINRINAILSEYFNRNPSVSKIHAKDMMPLFISKGIFPNDHRNGLPIRNVLRILDESKDLHLIPYVLAERKSVNTSWYFIPIKNSTTKIIQTKPVVNFVKKVTPKPAETQDKNAFPPIVNENCVVLILGSLPGDESLRRGEYYANPRNGFWKIMGQLFNGLPDSYKSRCDWLLKNKIALWDVLENGKRKGSLDSNIESGTPNDFSSFFKRYSNIKYVFFNGSKAQEDYLNYIRLDSKHVFNLLPSSSSARAIAFDSKVKDWTIIVK